MREEPTQASKTSLHFSTRSRLPSFFSTRPKLPCFFFFFTRSKPLSLFNRIKVSLSLPPFSTRPKPPFFFPFDPDLSLFSHSILTSLDFFFALPQMSPGKGSGFSGIKNIYTFTLVQMAATARNKKSVLYQEIIR